MKFDKMNKNVPKCLCMMLAVLMIIGCLTGAVTVVLADTTGTGSLLDDQQQQEALLNIDPVSYYFADIQQHWAKDSMMNLAYMGILKGIGNDAMKPESQVTRAEFVTMMVRALDLPEDGSASSGYADVNAGAWYYSAVNTAKVNGLISIFRQSNFYPDKPITREEMAVIASKAVESVQNTGASKTFKDISAAYTYINEINKVTSLGIISGTPAGYFKPYDRATRAQAAVIIQRIMSLADAAANNGQAIADAALNYQKAVMALDGRDETKTLNVFNLSSGKEKQTNGYRISLLNDQNAKGTSYLRSMSNEKAATLDSGKYLARAEVSYTAAVQLNGSAVYSEDIKLWVYLQKTRDGWKVYNTVDPDTIIAPPASGQGPVTLAWHYVSTKTPNMSGTQKINDLDIVSPTWFTLLDGSGSFKSTADAAYSDWAHKSGYKVWALVSNDFDASMTASLLNNATARNAAVNNLINLAVKYKLDGLNIDFENMRTQDKNAFTAFVGALYSKAKAKGITISVDVTVIISNSNWSTCYDRAALAAVSDYIVLMAYDQHWVGSNTVGSVAQLSWVDGHVKKVLQQVPAKKLILGMPFYTILWKEKTVAGSSTPVVTSTALSMSSAEQVVAANKAAKVWDAASGQYYVTYYKDGARYKMWMEDERSIKLKAALATKYGLAGTGAWKMGLEKNTVWPVIAQALNR